MSFLRPLHETISEFASAALGQLPLDTEESPVRVTSLELSIPIDLKVAQDDSDLLGDMPLFRRRTAFDPETVQLNIVLAEVAS